MALVASSVAAGNAATGLPLPRFVSLKAERANVRFGPGTDYPTKWIFVRRSLPVEIIQEYGNWRKIRDWQGQEGWILHSLLSGRRTALVKPWSGATVTPLRSSGSAKARILARLEPNVLVHVEACDGRWCQVRVRRFEGYLKQAALWGVYQNEITAE